MFQWMQLKQSRLRFRVFGKTGSAAVDNGTGPDPKTRLDSSNSVHAKKFHGFVDGSRPGAGNQKLRATQTR